MPPPLDIFLSVGETSGDLFAADVAAALRERRPGVRLHGLGGPRMAAQGVRLLADPTGHAVMGVLRAFQEANYYAGLYRRCVRFLNASPPNVLVPVDNPGFNLRLAELFRKRGVPVAYYVSPQVWAWRKGRIRRIRRAVDRMMCIFPFEKALYDAAGCDAAYVGHPAMDYLSRARFDAEAEALVRNLGEPAVGLLPGSRAQEVRQVFPVIAGAAALVQREIPSARFAVGCAEAAHEREARAILRAKGVQGAAFLTGKAWEIMRASRCCIAASGTATLELAYFGRPMVIVYRAPRFAEPFARRLLRSRIGIVNVVAGEEASPEFLMFRDDPRPAAQAALNLLQDESAFERQREALARVMAKVGPPGTAGRAAEAILELAEKRRLVVRP